MSLIDDIRKDREAGTAGPWSVPHLARDDVRCTCGYILAEYGGMGSIAEVSIAKQNDFDWGDDDGPAAPVAKANARRIARVPQMEAALIAAEELAKAYEALCEMTGKDFHKHECSKLNAFLVAIGAA